MQLNNFKKYLQYLPGTIVLLYVLFLVLSQILK